MAILAIIGTLNGATLGPHFKMFILAPPTSFVLVVVAFDGIAGGESVLRIAAAMAVVGTSVRWCYLRGGAFHASPATGHGRAPTPTSAAVSGPESI